MRESTAQEKRLKQQRRQSSKEVGRLTSLSEAGSFSPSQLLTVLAVQEHWDHRPVRAYTSFSGHLCSLCSQAQFQQILWQSFLKTPALLQSPLPILGHIWFVILWVILSLG